jgi:hypothetical protein
VSAADIYDFEGIAETAAKNVLTGMEIKAFTTRDKPDFQKDRPRVEIKFTLGAGLQRFMPVVNGAMATPATPNVTPTVLFYLRRESAWGFRMQFDLLTRDDIGAHADYRAQVRGALAQLWQLINGTAPMTRHAIQLGKDNGSSPVLIAPESGIMKTEMSFDGSIAVQANAWPALLEA